MKDFTSTGSSLREPSDLDKHVLNGWRSSTLRSYNSAVRKFLRFARLKINRRFELPATAEEIYGFCYWAGRTEGDSNPDKISGVTLTKYLHGLKAWHVYHGAEYPSLSNNKVALMLKASAKADALLVRTKTKRPVMVEHLLLLHDHLSKGDDLGLVLLDMSLVAFWGMARLGELASDINVGRLRKGDGVRISDVRVADDAQSALIKIYFAKTAVGGEVQHLLLTATNNKLCPVRALIRRISSGEAGDSLFGLNTSTERKNLTKSYCKRRLDSAWRGIGLTNLSGHSFRVGGASLRNALEVDITTICKLGRWTSSCYKLYIKPYTPEDLSVTLCILEQLDDGPIRLEH
ncbi:uncharacterized protein PGTG_20792 [Puccinia graminis f. sp. tritici CRL 75-36-700-3]|uniref:Tyr recombinase domain-containing protein n=1 Tax=Puccinia graminis f. sp. tritici (strain CRL 75-36-700-3 / race SCCL) TaxID=418459 RepID=H6QPL9_PUCGT|nr:uncharacterized protein PGTG_20792 [Puccinia graminis f. sp. tritici CRL 75-36-700-3]EHS64089.1 hypothetical protein PGTG_20792 [Puccinia graminis f. sp. tritici CRL 75-36-700-3]